LTLIADAGPLIVLGGRGDVRWRTVERSILAEPGPIVVPAPVTQEVDYLLRSRVGRTAASVFLSDLAAGRFEVACLDRAEYGLVLAYDRQYADFDVGLADLSIVVAAHRFRTKRILTFDERHFRSLRPLEGGAFILLPADETA
jgi:predicted nucleic acid-binding protein